MEKLLIIDDDIALCELLTEYFSSEGFQITAVHDGNSGVKTALSEEFDIIVLDVMLPELNGFEVLRSIRSKIDLPIIMLTAKGDDIDRIIGLEMGADDYLAKPFNPRELIARIRAIFRRTKSEKEELSTKNLSKKIIIGDIEMNISARVVKVNDEKIDITSIEFKILEYFLKNAGRLIPREELSSAALERELLPNDRTIDVHVSKLRKKLGNYNNGMERIKTIRSVGYLYAINSDKNE
ncbi:MAG: response regulator transcription factor [Candidatus Wallbacteria bacterium]